MFLNTRFFFSIAAEVFRDASTFFSFDVPKRQTALEKAKERVVKGIAGPAPS